MTRILALDVGDKTIGVAASDALGITAQGITTVRRENLAKDLATLKKLVAEYDADTLVLGLPKNMNGTEGERCVIVRELAEHIKGCASIFGMSDCQPLLRQKHFW